MKRFELVENKYGSGYMVHYEKALEEQVDGEWVAYADAKLAVARAFCIAAHDATGQVRKYTGLPYHTHPIAVENILKAHAKNVTLDMSIAALLHDVVEDTKMPIETIRSNFGDEVASLVAGMTKNVYPGGTKRKDKFEAEVVRLAATSPDVKSIKIADSIHNMIDFIFNDPKYAREVYLPEKRILLDRALKEGDTTLWLLADLLINNFLKGEQDATENDSKASD